MDPIFIIGTERSGTNLLRLILDSHPSIAIPHPPHIMKNFFALEPHYGDLGDDRNFRALISDVVTSVELHPYPWETAIDRERVFREARSRELVSVFFAVYDQYREARGKQRWGCKSTFMIRHVALVLRHYPEARFIYMVRDGRDVAVSARDSIFNHFNAYFTAQLWKREQQTGIYWLRTLASRQIFLLKYEELLADPAKTVAALCDFLGEPFQEGMLRFFESREARKSGALSVSWKNTSRPIIAGNSGKFRKGLRESDIRLFEAVAGPELDWFGYPLTRPFAESEAERARGIPRRLSYVLEENLLRARAQLIHLFSDTNNFLRFRKWLFLSFVRLTRSWR